LDKLWNNATRLLYFFSGIFRYYLADGTNRKAVAPLFRLNWRMKWRFTWVDIAILAALVAVVVIAKLVWGEFRLELTIPVALLLGVLLGLRRW